MKIRQTDDSIYIDLSPAEARVLLDELSHVRGGARLPKLKQVCHGLEALLVLMPTKRVESDAPRRSHRSKVETASST